MEKLTCTCCGAPINRTTMTCEYCGTKYKMDGPDVIRIETYTNPVRTLAISNSIDFDTWVHFLHGGDLQAFSEMLLRNMANKLAENLVPFLSVQTEDDIHTRTKKVTAVVKVVQPVNGGII